MIQKPKILVIGSINMDLLLLTERIPLAGESMLSEKYQFGPGGKGANQAVACALLGGDTTFVCKIGSDAFGEQLRRSLIDKGVSVNYVSVSHGKQSGFSVIILENDNNRIITHLAANLDLHKNDIDRAFENGNYDGMIVQFEITEELVIYACEKARGKGIPFIVDAGPALDFPLEKIYGMEILSPNETETAALCGITPSTKDECEAAAEILTKRAGAKHIVLKMGDKGATHYQNGKTTHFPPMKVDPVDVTAAGDVFTAALSVQYLQHGDISKAIQFANVAGALTVTKAGAQQSIPTACDVITVAAAKP
jgi:ribokinase